jgi:hypothetical protein
MVPCDRPDQTRTRTPLPPELERKLQLCEGIVERMRVLQEQVDWEIRQGRLQGRRQTHSLAADREKPYEAGPVVRLAVSSVLRWMTETLVPRRG